MTIEEYIKKFRALAEQMEDEHGHFDSVHIYTIGSQMHIDI